MKQIILFLFISFVFSNCQTKNENVSFDNNTTDDINAIVEAIIIQNSLNVFNTSKDSRMFCSELKKVIIEIPEKRKDGLTFPPMPGNIYISNILHDKIDGEVFFSAKDSLTIIKQNSNPEKFEISLGINRKLNLTTYDMEITKRKTGKKYNFYEMSIPIFSLDRQRAFVELDHRCGSLCGSGKGFYLKKVNGKWKIIEKFRTWIS